MPVAIEIDFSSLQSDVERIDFILKKMLSDVNTGRQLYIKMYKWIHDKMVATKETPYLYDLLKARIHEHLPIYKSKIELYAKKINRLCAYINRFYALNANVLFVGEMVINESKK